MTRLAQHAAGLYASLEAETGQATGFRQTGSSALATSAAPVEELRHGASMARCFGLEVDTLGAAEVAEKWPGVDADDLVGGVFLPKDGRTNPIDATQALARGERARAGTTVPLHAAEHFFIVTEPMAGLSPSQPVLRDPDGCACVMEDAGKLLVGWFEPKSLRVKDVGQAEAPASAIG